MDQDYFGTSNHAHSMNLTIVVCYIKYIVQRDVTQGRIECACPKLRIQRPNYNDSNEDLFTLNHDDVIKWKHLGPLNSPHKGQWRGALIFSLICVWINGWVNNRKAGDLRRYGAHYDVIVMEVGMGIRLKIIFNMTDPVYSKQKCTNMTSKINCRIRNTTKWKIKYFENGATYLAQSSLSHTHTHICIYINIYVYRIPELESFFIRWLCHQLLWHLFQLWHRTHSDSIRHSNTDYSGLEWINIILRDFGTDMANTFS